MCTSFWDCCISQSGDFLRIKILERLQALIDLKASNIKLVKEMRELNSMRKDKEDRATVEEGKKFGWKRTDVLNEWLESVGELGEKVRKFDDHLNGPQINVDGEVAGFPSEAKAHEAGDHLGGGCCCGLCEMIKPCCCRCCCGLCNLLKLWGGRLCVLVKLSGEVADLIGEVRDLKEKGERVTDLLKEELGGKETCDISMVGKGAKEALDGVRRHLKDPTKGIIGIYGTAGVGKTDLLKKIEQEYTGTNEYPRVILVEVIRTADMDKLLLEDPYKIAVDVEGLRKSIGKKLASSSSTDWDAESLKRALSSKRFLLLLENVWEKLDLEEIGIPRPNSHNKCKIVFTTRSNAVRKDMDAEGVEMNRLTDDEDVELFRRELKDDGAFAKNRAEAQRIVEECHGLPLAVKVMARVMRNKNLDGDWRRTADALRDPRTMFDDGLMEEENVFKPLLYSYYHLRAEWRPCFLYCSLLDSCMDVDELIDYWTGEGFLDCGGKAPDMETGRWNGRKVINELISACLLECSSNKDGKLRMHGLIRDMAIRKSASELLVYPDSMDRHERKGKNWERTKRISLMGSNVSTLPTRDCTHLVTLLLKNCPRLTKIPAEFFNKMPALRVLDLSHTGIDELPEGIINLKQLRYLNLSHTGIRSVPLEVRAMDELIQLNLSFTCDLERIPYEAISGCAQLRTLNLFKSRYGKWVWDARDPERGVSLSDLDGLPNLEELSLTIFDDRGFTELLKSDVAESTVCLQLDGFGGLTTHTPFEVLEKLRELHITNVQTLGKLVLKRKWLLNLETFKLSALTVAGILVCEEEEQEPEDRAAYRLRRVEISKCSKLVDLSWVRHLGCIDTLSVSQCSRLKAVIASDDGAGHGGDKFCFKSLKSITLKDLPNLEYFSKSGMEMYLVPSLTVDDCPKLTGEFIYYDKHGKKTKLSYQQCQKQVTMA